MLLPDCNVPYVRHFALPERPDQDRQTPDAPPAAPDEIHVWRVDLTAVSVPSVFRSLSDDERARAGRFRFDHDRNRFVACRGALRQILGRYLDGPPESIRFAYGPRGKPFLEQGGNGPGLRFNVSHALDDAVVAVTAGREVGIDVEHARTGLDPVELAGRFFTPGERAFIERHEPGQRPGAFLACWTRKEAWLKAAGVGMAGPLDLFDVSPALGQPIAALRLGSPFNSDWIACEVEAGENSAVALVVEAYGS